MCYEDRMSALAGHRKIGGYVMDDVTTLNRAVLAVDEAVLFSMKNTPLLEQGTSYTSLATAENLWTAIKVYASGGENALHAHGGEDHIFVVLQGKAENLVLLRVGGGERSVKGLAEVSPFGTPKDVQRQTSFADGAMKVGNAKENGESSKRRVVAKGKYFSPD
jgi:hypothetical protein